MYIDNQYLTNMSSEDHLTMNLNLSIGIGIKRIINRHGAILLDFETDYFPFLKSDNFNLNFLALKLGFEFNTPLFKGKVN